MTYNYSDDLQLQPRTFALHDGPAGWAIMCLVCGFESNSASHIHQEYCPNCDNHHPVRIKDTEVCDALFHGKDMIAMKPDDIREVRKRATWAGQKEIVKKCNKALSEIWGKQ